MIDFFATVTAVGLRASYMPNTSNYMLPASSWHKTNFRKPKLPPEMKGSIAADSGAFMATRSPNGNYPFEFDDYAAWLYKFNPQWAATMDYLCLPEIAENSEAIRERQERTTYMAWLSWKTCSDIQWTPTIQGINAATYKFHAKTSLSLIKEMQRSYQHDDYKNRFRVGVGSLVGRESHEIYEILFHINEILNMPLHLFGIKLKSFQQKGALSHSNIDIASVDSAAWDSNGMKKSGLQNRAERQQMGLTKMEYTYKVLLPRYEAKVSKALESPKQQRLIGTNNHTDHEEWDKNDLP